MSLPTLLKPNTIKVAKWMSKEQKIQLTTMQSIEWIINYLEDRVWNKNTPPKIKIKGPGYKVGVFRSGTGTGKSTVFPPYIYNKFYEELKNTKTIICTQPTVATATDIPYQIVAYNKNLELGKNIGFQTGSLIRKAKKGILFATIGILLQHLKLLTDEEFMNKYSFIILDEIHLRSVETDTTLFYLRRFLERNYENPECPFIILTSGTFEPKIFMEYFSCPESSFLDIVGSSFPIVDNYSTFDVSDYISYSIDLVEKIHVENVSDITKKSEFRDVLIFVQGVSQIKEIVEKLHKLNTEVFSKGLNYSIKHNNEQQKKYGGKEKIEKYYICPIAVTSKNMQKGGIEYQNIFSDVNNVKVPIYKFVNGEITDKIINYEKASRRVIIATNAIETGITIDTLKYCIDTGYVNESQFNPDFGVNMLINKSVTQASSKQRRGRVGRKDPGVFYTAYTKETYDKLIPLPYPDIVRNDITSSLLDIIMNETETKLIEVDPSELDKYPEAFQMNNFDQRWYSLHQDKSFNLANLIFIQSPSANSFTYSLEKLRILGFIDHSYNITIYGWFGSKIRKTSIESIRMILAGYHHGANILDLITIVIMMNNAITLGIKRKKYKPRNILNLSEKNLSLYYKNLFTDEFIEYLFIWDEFINEVEEIGDTISKELKKANSNSSNLLILKKVEKYCLENNFDMDTLLLIINQRDEMISDLLNVGMNPFYNGLSLPRGKYNLVNILQNNIQDGIDEIRKIKNCIYEGYRMNLYIWNEGSKSYVSPINHTPITLESKILSPLTLDKNIKQSRPQKIIVSSVILRESNNESGIYEFIGSEISSLDGYVDLDVDFNIR
jgi:HrpA-like RNA helicase